MIEQPRYRYLRRTCTVLLLGVLASPFSHACRVPPRAQVVTPDEQIAMATDVSVAKVVRASPSAEPTLWDRLPMDYEFEVQQRISFFGAQRFTITGAQGETRPPPSSSDHSDKEFWQRGGGRLYNDPDCVLRPDFVVGEYYLVFRGEPATWRSFEHIQTVDGRPNPDDKWLSYVKAKLGARPAVSVPPQS